MSPCSLLIVSLLTFATAFLLTSMARHALVYDEARLNRSIGDGGGDGAGAFDLPYRLLEQMPQNAWWLAQRRAMRDLAGSSSILRAEIFRRPTDGLIVFRPLDWYVYYRPGEKFYYLTNTYDGSAICSSNECSVVILEPTTTSGVFK